MPLSTTGFSGRIQANRLVEEFETALHRGDGVVIGQWAARAPKNWETWVLYHLLEIEREQRQASGDPADRATLKAIVDCDVELFNSAWAAVESGEEPPWPNDQSTGQETDVPTCAQHPLRYDAAHRTGESDTITLEGATEPYRTKGAGAEASPVRIDDDFELLDEIGKGGMGTVYRARQVNLGGREVALKIIPKDRLSDPQALERFIREANISGAMNHPGIVPVYGLGEQNGQYYYVMPLITGGSLARFTGERAESVTPRQAATYLLKIARAVQHAHDHGVIHRDIKPANILLDNQGQLYLADFGLAKDLNHDEELTASEDVLGTPSYMAPEQAAGHAKLVDRPADVYSLGATLYALLSGSPPFRGRPYDVLKQVIESEPVSLRICATRVPIDLRTICHKSMAKLPQDRYASAGCLADDLQRYLDGRPIEARPLSRAGRTLRWCRRNPLVASLTAAVAVSLVVGTIISTAFAVQAKREAKRANVNATNASQEAQRANDSADQIVSVIEDSFVASEELLSRLPGMQEMQASFLAPAIEHLQAAAKINATSADTRLAAAKTKLRLGKILALTQGLEEADEEFKAAFAILGRPADASDADLETLTARADIHQQRGKLCSDRFEKIPAESPLEDRVACLEDWISYAREALHLREIVAARHRDVERKSEAERLKANSMTNLASACAVLGELDGFDEQKRFNLMEQGNELMLAAHHCRRETLDNYAHNVDLQADLAASSYNLALIRSKEAGGEKMDRLQTEEKLRDANDYATEAIETYRGILDELNQTAADAVNYPRHHFELELAKCHQLRGQSLMMLYDPFKAEEDLLQAVRFAGMACESNPSIVEYRTVLAGMQFDLALNLLWLSGMETVQRADYHDRGEEAFADMHWTLIEAMLAAPSPRADQVKKIGAVYVARTLKAVGAFQEDSRQTTIRSGLLQSAINRLQQLRDRKRSSDYDSVTGDIGKLREALANIERKPGSRSTAPPSDEIL